MSKRKMTQQKAIEIYIEAVAKRMGFAEIIPHVVKQNLKPVGECAIDALLASDFCSDSVRELVKEMHAHLVNHTPWSLKLRNSELLRSIVEENGKIFN